MNLRLGAVSGACIALLAGSSPCLAAKHKGAPAAPDSAHASHSATKPSHKGSPAPKEPIPNHHPAGIGGLLGGGRIYADADYSNRRTPSGEFGSKDSEARFAFSANFRYQFNPWLRGQVSPGFFWSAYDQHSPLPFQDANHPGLGPAAMDADPRAVALPRRSRSGGVPRLGGEPPQGDQGPDHQGGPQGLLPRGQR